MRFGLTSALLGAMIVAAPAAAMAQTDQFAGTWAFQTENYGNATTVTTLAGAAIISPKSGDKYDVQLVAFEAWSKPGAPADISNARENCDGTLSGQQLTVKCTVTDVVNSKNYKPDDFVLTVVDADHLSGPMNSYSTSTAKFTRVR